ncbi:YncE family protein [Terriglobus albidus]|uniref:YncE family protein n=1 Tax=Terriglobus albidus TaxID=1592106 RepID=UPI0021E03923|nr:YncE family protein [Terriglobus albidus]
MRRLPLYSRSLVAGIVLATAAWTATAQMPQQSLLVLSKRDHTLSIIDPTSLKVLASAPVGADPHEVIASDDGRRAYVSIYGGGAYHVLNVIDLVSGKPLKDIDTGALNGPHGLTYIGGKLWFTAEGAKAIARLDPTTEKIDWIMGTGQDRTHMIFVTPDQKQIYTTNVSSATVSALEEKPMAFRPPPMPAGNAGGPPPGAPSGSPPGMGRPRTMWEQTLIPVGPGDEGFDVTPDGRELWTANAQDGTISVIDIAAKKNVATLQADVKSANRLKFTLDGKYALISLLGRGDLVVYDVAARKEFKRVPIGHGAAGILVEPGGKRAFVSCGPDNYVAVVDLTMWQVVGHIDAGGEPDGLAWASRR